MRRSLALALLSASLAVSPAAATERSATDRRGDVRAGLDAAERKSVDITRLSLLSDEKGLLIVDVALAGDFNGRLGRGDLRRAVVGVVLRPAGGKPTIVGTTGSRRRPDGAKRGPGKVVLIDRDRSSIRFVLSGLATPASIAAVAVPRASRSAARGLASFDPFGLTMIELVADAEDRKIKDRNDRLLLLGITPKPPTCDQMRRFRKRLLDERQELVSKRALADDAAERRPIQEAINTLDAQIDDVERDIASFCNRPSTAPPPPPEEFATSWAHGTGRSRICVYVTGRPGQTGDVTIDGTDSPRTQPFTLDSDGRATAIFEISRYGSYPVGSRWQQADGSSTVRNGSVTVAEGAGPAPPAGFAACPPP